ncbi:MAG: GspH/FimT family pseudopilin [Gammaproteobacteria bacterium]|nr:GspH/FimT family pseudopilin [Gammaproteobacteria bacterium]
MKARLHIRRHAGFTLIEAMVTVAVIAILAAIAVPAFQNIIDKRRLKEAAEQLYSDMQYARGEALKQNTPVTVAFGGVGGTSWCYGIDDTPATACDCANSPGNCTINGVEKVVTSTGFRGISITSTTFGGNDTGFDSVRGMSIENGTASLSSSTGSKVDVIVGRVGRVRLCSPSGTGNIPDYPAC